MISSIGRLAAMASGLNRKCSLTLLFLCLHSVMVSSTTLIIHGKNVSLSFDGIGANFAPPVPSSGLCGKLILADPIDACSPLRNKVEPIGNSNSSFALVIRGGCSFEEKVRAAQRANFKAVIVYDNEYYGSLVARNPAGIKIHAIFVSRLTGETLSKYVGCEHTDLCLLRSFENSAWSIMAISFISLLAMSAVLATCFFVRRHHRRRERPSQSRVREFHGMSSRLVKAMPSLVFTSVVEDNSTSATCAICLEDYRVGEKIRVLPCKHKFHAVCVDCWLTSWRTFCPVCKQDARTGLGVPISTAASESTPLLLSSNPSSLASSPQSVPSSYRSTSSIRITASSLPRSNPSSSIMNYSPSIGASHLRRSIHSHHIHIPSPSPSPSHASSMMMTASRSSVDLQNLSARRSMGRMGSLHGSSLGYPSISPLNSGYYLSPYNYSPAHGSSSYRGMNSSQQQQNPLHYSTSAASFSPYSSAQSLPGC